MNMDPRVGLSAQQSLAAWSGASGRPPSGGHGCRQPGEVTDRLLLGGLPSSFDPVGGRALRDRLFSAADIGRRFLSGLASDLLSGVAAAAGVFDLDERRAGAGGAEDARRSCSTSVSASISAW